MEADPATGDVHLVRGPPLPGHPVPRRVDPHRERLRPAPRPGPGAAGRADGVGSGGRRVRPARHGHRHPGAAAGRAAGGDGAGVALDDLGDDREAQPGAGHRARLARAPEPLEDVGQVLLGDAGALVVDGQHAVRQPYRDGPALGAPLGGVVEQVGHGPLQAAGVAGEPPRLGRAVERHARCPPAYPRQRPVDDVLEVDRLHDGRGHRVVAGQLDQVADQRGQLADLGAYVLDQLGPGVLGEVGPGLGEQVEVGAQRGERGPQLVPGVGDQPALPVAGGGERGEHVVEGGGQPRDLVVALDGERPEVLGAGDALDRTGEPPDRPQPVARHRPAGGTGGDDTGDPEDQHHRPELGQRLPLRLQRLREHQRLPGHPRGHGDDAVVLAVLRPRSCGRSRRCAARRRRAPARRAGGSGPGRRSGSAGRR